jgi:hypothetical protein
MSDPSTPAEKIERLHTAVVVPLFSGLPGRPQEGLRLEVQIAVRTESA